MYLAVDECKGMLLLVYVRPEREIHVQEYYQSHQALSHEDCHIINNNNA
jgi:hypothetical protein